MLTMHDSYLCGSATVNTGNAKGSEECRPADQSFGFKDALGVTQWGAENLPRL